jgi:hypothetical protein
MTPAARPIDEVELRLLADQLARMRGMLFGYSERFFERIRTWAIVSIALLVLGATEIAPAAAVPVPFLVPFAFLETGYLFFYTVFARRHAERLEEAINERFGREVLAAHRLEAAYFYPPDRAKIAAFSFGNPLGMMSVTTLGYTAGAAILWVAGMIGLTAWVGRIQAQYATIPDYADLPDPVLLGFLAPSAIAWTMVIAAYLVWAFLTRRDEDRLLRELDTAYLDPASPSGEPPTLSGEPPTAPGDQAL